MPVSTALLIAITGCASTPQPVPARQCSAESCPVHFTVIDEEPEPCVSDSISAAQGVVDALEADAGEVEWIERSNANEEPSP